MVTSRAQALASAVLLFAIFVAPPAPADTAADCSILKKAAGEYSKLASDLARLRKTADEQQADTAALAATQRKVVDVTREIGRKLRKAQVYLENPVLSYAFNQDALSFEQYADTLEGAISNGDIAGANIHVTATYTRNLDAVEAANDAYHSQCK